MTEYVSSRWIHDDDSVVRTPTSRTEQVARLINSPQITNRRSLGGSSAAFAPGRVSRIAAIRWPTQTPQPRIANSPKTKIDHIAHGGGPSTNVADAMRHECHNTPFPDTTINGALGISLTSGNASVAPGTSTGSRRYAVPHFGPLVANSRWLESGRQRYVESAADCSDRAFLNLAVSWYRHFPHILRVQPDIMITAVVVQQAATMEKMTVHLGSLHTSPLP